jgi:hypothetical protein
MHFSALLLAASAAVVHSASTVTNTATVTSTLSPQETCLANCNKGDVTCQAQCVGVPHPGASQMNLTTNCVANCDQGDGSPAASAAYAACMNACISSYIILTGTAAPGGDYSTAGVTPSGVSASTTATGTGKFFVTMIDVLAIVC